MKANALARLKCVAMLILAVHGLSQSGEVPAEKPHGKSWIWVDGSNGGKPLAEGDTWEIPVEYYLDPTDAADGAILSIWGAGPWIDCPDGKYETKRHHVDFAKGIGGQIPVKPGQGRQVFKVTVPPALPQVRKNNHVMLICNFKDNAHKDFPWQVRETNTFLRKSGFFELETDKPGNLFLYQDPVRFTAKLRNVKDAGQEKSLSYSVHDVNGKEVTKGEVKFKVEKDDQEIPIPLEIKTKGTFVIEAEVAGWEKRSTNFARIPDVPALTNGGKTPFGMTNDLSEDSCRIAQRLGLNMCRRFTSWNRLNPGSGVFKLDEVEKDLVMARKYGIDPWICIVDPPVWALEGRARNVDYNAFKGDWEAWREFVKTATTRFKGKMYGWEWLNEITPGGSENFVDDYVTLCRIGTETVRGIDPSMKMILAGGLWPRSFRASVLAAGVGKYVDVLPVHYSNGGGVLEARADLDGAGCSNVVVWDNETSRGVNAWNVPPVEEIANTQQANWVFTQFVDELSADCQKVIFFGGEADAAGNWTYLMDDHSPRPVAATLAVLSSKLFGAKPLGVFSLGNSGLFHLFERDGKPIMVCSSYEKTETVALQVGAEKLVATDYQGEEREIAAPGGKANLTLAEMRYFLEGGDLDVLKAYVVPTILSARAAMKRSKLVETPRVSLLKGTPGELCVKLHNFYDRELSGRLVLQSPEGWPAVDPPQFSLKAGEEKIVSVPLTIPDAAQARDYSVSVAFEFAWTKLPRIEKPAVLSVLSPEMLGNLMPNGDFEAPNKSGNGPEGWDMNGTTRHWVNSEGLGDGLGQHVLKFTDTKKKYDSTGRTLNLRGGQTYLYTAWLWNQKMSAGSNIYQNLADGTTKPMYDVQVFTAGMDNAYWQMYTCRYKAPENLKSVGFVPVVNGEGWALYDNIRVTIFQGTDFAAECHRAKTPPKIDGDLSDWVTRCPIPLIGKNQLTVVDKGYNWTPQNLNGVAYAMWDDANLYVAIKVRDDIHHALTGEETDKGDCVILAFDPANRAPQADEKAFCYWLSSAVPGGSGKHTIFRPKERSGGLQSGHLLRDSSIYEMAVVKGEGTCTYELRIPFSELNGIRPGVGSRFGFSIQLNDNDGKGPAAHMNWGGGVSPNWKPSDFGVMTIVE